MQLIGAGTWRPEDPDFWIVGARTCVFVCVSFIFNCFNCFYTTFGTLLSPFTLCRSQKRNPKFRSTITKRGTETKRKWTHTRIIWHPMSVSKHHDCWWRQYAVTKCNKTIHRRSFPARTRSRGHASHARSCGQHGLDNAHASAWWRRHRHRHGAHDVNGGNLLHIHFPGQTDNCLSLSAICVRYSFILATMKPFSSPGGTSRLWRV